MVGEPVTCSSLRNITIIGNAKLQIMLFVQVIVTELDSSKQTHEQTKNGGSIT